MMSIVLVFLLSALAAYFAGSLLNRERPFTSDRGSTTVERTTQATRAENNPEPKTVPAEAPEPPSPPDTTPEPSPPDTTPEPSPPDTTPEPWSPHTTPAPSHPAPTTATTSAAAAAPAP